MTTSTMLREPAPIPTGHPAPRTARPAEATRRFTVTTAGPFELAASARFLEGVLPITDRPASVRRGDAGVVVTLAFVPDGERDAVGVRIERAPQGLRVAVTRPAGRIDDPQLARIRAQVARIFSLDVDGTDYPLVGDRDPVVGALLARYGGLRPVTFLSPYEAAAWFLIGHRIRMPQAATIKHRLAALLGEPVEIDGVTHHAFPAPAVLAGLDADPVVTAGLTEKKIGYLRALGRAAAETDLLDGATIRANGAAAIDALRTLPGVGPFTADGIVLRGAGEPDVLTLNEPRLAWAVQRAYELDRPPTDDELTSISEAWQPFRTWITVLLRVALEDGTHEIRTGTRPPGVLRRTRTR
jgi:DNA-3-methyladenine glycosylase II